MKFYYYATQQTKDLLETGRPQVLLYGSNMGYANFGDIIQLKGAIKFHKARTRLEPIVILRMDAPYGAGRWQDNITWYETENFLYMSRKKIRSEESFGLVQVNPIRHQKEPYLHVYGGGFLNSFWGQDMLDEIEAVMESFGVVKYVFSGQQVSQAVAVRLKKVFKQRKPGLVGARDKESYKILKSISPSRARFSFDDVTEVFEEWSGFRGNRIKQTSRALLSKSVAWHFNMTGYVASSYDTIIARIAQINKQFPRRTHIILQAYDDRDNEALDSLQSIVKMETKFPLSSYKVLNLSKLALESRVNSAIYPDVTTILSPIVFAVTSSYHTAMFVNYFGIPAFLMSFNEFYDQKQKSLGYTVDMDEFLANPKRNLNKFREHRAARAIWLEELERYFRT